jgi:tetratricopeptide (TPR) repeat protein
MTHARLAVVLGGALLATLLLGAPRAHADSQRELFQRASAAYARGDYAAAIATYERLADSGVEDPDVSYDLALAYAKRGTHGRAILWFERALSLAPGDEAAEAGITASTGALGRRRADASGETTMRTRPPFREAAVRGVRANTLAVLVLLLSALFFGVLGALRFVRGETPRLALWIAAPLLGLLLGTSTLGLAQKAGLFDEGAPAIVLGADPELREAPDPRATTRGIVHEGERARVIARDRGWSRIRLSGAREGWLPNDLVGELERRTN